jgi:hypothetical protein
MSLEFLMEVEVASLPVCRFIAIESCRRESDER